MKKRNWCLCGAVLLLVLSGCQKDKPVPIVEDITDLLDKEDKYDEVLSVFVLDGKPFTVNDAYEIELPVNEPLEEGHFYRVVADVTLLNGGVAGYVNHPEIHEVKECAEVSPFDLNLPSVAEAKYGLCRIEDYGDGDLILNDYFHLAVWKDGAWIYRYDQTMKLEDGTLVCCRKGITEAEIQKGLQAGIRSCESYFAYPAEAETR